MESRADVGTVLRRTAGILMKGLGLVFIVAILSSPIGCARTRTVYIPPEWNSASPSDAEGRQGQARSPETLSDQSSSAVLKPGPGFRETDLPSGPEPAPPGATKKVVPVSPEQEPPQRLASMHLVDQGKASLAQGKPDAAIPLFEQAIQVDVHNGEAFFGLAKAWRMKGSRNKAQEFARKAEILFQDNPGKLKAVYLFEAELFKELGDTKRMEAYQEKASKL